MRCWNKIFVNMSPICSSKKGVKSRFLSSREGWRPPLPQVASPMFDTIERFFSQIFARFFQDFSFSPILRHAHNFAHYSHILRPSCVKLCLTVIQKMFSKIFKKKLKIFFHSLSMEDLRVFTKTTLTASPHLRFFCASGYKTSIHELMRSQNLRTIMALQTEKQPKNCLQIQHYQK